MRNKRSAVAKGEKANELAKAPTDLITYREAKNILTKRFPDTTGEEIAIWVFMEPPESNGTNLRNDLDDFEDYAIHGMGQGGIKSYFSNDTERDRVLEIYSRATVGETIGWEEICRNMFLRRFSLAEIKSFTPPDRWISFEKLMLRWTNLVSHDDAAALIETELDKDAPGILRELTMSYPVTIIRQSREICMYSIHEIEAIEKKAFPVEILESEPGMESTLQSIDRKDVMNAFAVKADPEDNIKFWDDKLGSPPQWLIEARVKIGKRGISSRWNPLSVAHCLLDMRHMNLRQLDAEINKSFPEMFEQWKDETVDLRN